MIILSTLRIAVRALMRNTLRTLLTMLGIIIGVSAVISLLSIGQGVEKFINSQFNALGTNAVKEAVVLMPTGAGKTTFVRGACRALGVTGAVTSPTFTIGHRYDAPIPVAHLDLGEALEVRGDIGESLVGDAAGAFNGSDLDGVLLTAARLDNAHHRNQLACRARARHRSSVLLVLEHREVGRLETNSRETAHRLRSVLQHRCPRGANTHLERNAGCAGLA